jgi:hypothetical protein
MILISAILIIGTAYPEEPETKGSRLTIHHGGYQYETQANMSTG